MDRPISFQQLRASFEENARQLHGLVAGVAHATGGKIEDRARANVQARLTMRSRELWASIRTEVDDQHHGLVELRALAGGTWNGLRIAYARIQEEGGLVLPVHAKVLAIPVGPALTGPGVARYPSARMAPNLVPIIPSEPRGNLVGWLVNKDTGETWYLWLRSTLIKGVHYLRDAVQSVHAELGEELQRLLSHVLAAEA